MFKHMPVPKITKQPALKATSLSFILLSIFFSVCCFTGCITTYPTYDYQYQYAEERVNVESYGAGPSTSMPEDFQQRVAQAEERYKDQWEKFDEYHSGSPIYYGLLRGQSIGEFKMAIDQNGTIHSIMLVSYGLNYVAASFPQMRRFSQQPGETKIKLKDEGYGYFGRFGSLMVGQITEKGDSFATGSYKFNLGINGLMSGKFFGIKMEPEGPADGLMSIHNTEMVKRILERWKGQIRNIEH